MPDYVIVGGGSAGCVLAGRLSADPTCSVELVEAGGPERGYRFRVPLLFSWLFRTAHDWDYRTAPQTALVGRSLYWPRGKALGGSSALNAMIYMRGHRGDYDAWRDAGCPGWGWDDVLPSFRRAEHRVAGATDLRGSGGPLWVSPLRCVNPLTRAFVGAAQKCGIPFNADFNGPEQAGVGYHEVTQKQGRRHSANTAYLRPALGRRNLRIRTGVTVERLLVESDRVTGVVVGSGGNLHEIRADRAVLLCAGAVGSPQLLLRSGIGPADDLTALGIRVHLDAPEVGANLQDHLAIGIGCHCAKPVTLWAARRAWPVLRYMLTGGGPLTSNVAEAGAFIRTHPDAARPDVQFHFAPVHFIKHGLEMPRSHGYGIAVTQLRPFSRGRISLASGNAADPPQIDPGYLSDERDLSPLLAGLRLAREVLRASEFNPYRSTEAFPGHRITSDTDLSAFVRRGAESSYHPVGTCRMGSDDRAVVDPQLRLRGLAGLRVVDASVMPTLVGGNTNAPTIMIAERAAEMIRGGSGT